MNDDWQNLYGSQPDMFHARDGDTLKDAIIDAARALVNQHIKHVIDTKRNPEKERDEPYLHMEIEYLGYTLIRDLSEDDTTNDLFGALATLLSAVESYDEWRVESESANS